MTDYRLLTFQAANGPRAGVMIGENVFDAAELTHLREFVSVWAILQDWDSNDALLAQAATNPSLPPVGRWTELTLLAPSDTRAIYCAGANFKTHVRNMEKKLDAPEENHDGSMDPWFFLKTPHTLVGTGAEIQNPYAKLDWEGELGLVIGRPARNVPVEAALDYVAGYFVANDLSARDLMFRRGAVAGSAFHYDWISQKVFEGGCPIGPWITPATQVADPQALILTTTVNGVTKQHSSTSEMIYSVAEQIAFLSKRFALRPGDIILTGTPPGVGMEGGEFLAVGDEVAVEIEGLGRVANRIVPGE